MMACCSQTSVSRTRRGVCPVNGQSYRQVSVRTLQHHLSRPWQRELPDQVYFFCTDPDCEVVYFGDDGRCFSRDQVRTDVGQKVRSAAGMLCYCFDIRRQDLKGAFAMGLREYVLRQTREGRCNCVVCNPSGRCCLQDFPPGTGK